MKPLRLIFFMLLALISLNNCKKFEGPSWESQLLAPLFKTTLQIEDIIRDSSITSRNDSIYLIFRKELSELTMDSVISLNVDPYLKNVKLDSIHLGDQNIHQAIRMEEVLDDAGLTVEDGEKVPFPNLIFPITGLSVGPDTVDGSEYFQYIHLKEGILELSIDNGFPVSIKNITYTLHLSETDSIQRSFPDIMPYTTEVDTVNLQGREVKGEIRFKIDFDLDYEGGDVVVNYDDSIAIDVSIKDMRIHSATAFFPAQQIIYNEEVNYLEGMNDVELTEGTIQQGRLRIRVISTIEEETFFTYSIPGAKLNNVPFKEEIPVAAAPPGGKIEKEFWYDFDGYVFDFTGFGDTVNAFYSEITGRIDSTETQVNLTLEDSVDVIVEVVDLVPEVVWGYMGQSVFDIGPDTIAFDVFESFNLDSLSITKSRMRFGIENHLGTEGAIFLQDICAHNNLDDRKICLNQQELPDSFFIESATWQGDVVPKTSFFTINEQNANTNEMIGLLPNQFSYRLQIKTNPEGNHGNYTDFAKSKNQIKPFIDIEVPFMTEIANIHLTDTFDLELPGNKRTDQIQEGKINFHIENQFPIEAHIALCLIGEDKVLLDSLTSSKNISAGKIESTSEMVLQAESSIISFNINKEVAAHLRSTKQLSFHIHFSTIPEGKSLQFYDHYHMDIKTTGNFTYLTKGPGQ